MKISDSILYVGVNDKQTDLFESQYIIPEGISYNSYVILDQKPVIMDSVDERLGDEWLANVRAALNGASPEYIVVKHVEPDHSGSLCKILEAYPNIKVVGNAKTFQFLGQLHGITLPEERKVIVKEADKLSVGAHTLEFVMAPMVHWPEAMVALEETEGVLFSADAFGKFGVPVEGDDDWDCEARRYYFNICGKYGVQVQGLLKKVGGLNVKTICPLHGPVLSGDLTHYIKQYDTWSRYEPETEGVFVAYASIHGNTAAAAKELAELLKAKGVKVAISDLSRDDMAECIEDAFRYPKMVLAASTYDGGIFTPMANFLHSLKMKNYQKRAIALVENGTWAPTAANQMRQLLSEMKEIAFVGPTVSIRSRLDDTSRARLKELAEAL